MRGRIMRKLLLLGLVCFSSLNAATISLPPGGSILLGDNQIFCAGGPALRLALSPSGHIEKLSSQRLGSEADCQAEEKRINAAP